MAYSLPTIYEYYELQRKYEHEYGPKTVLFYQFGDFYEFYQYIKEEDDIGDEEHESIGCVKDLCELDIDCHWRIIRGNRHSYKYPFTMGFPISYYDIKAEEILKAGYTIVVYNQVKGKIDNVTKRTKRVISKIETPALSLENPSSSNMLVCIYIETIKHANKYEEYMILVGLSYVDIHTGENGMFEVYSQKDDPRHALQDMYRYLQILNPVQTLIFVNHKKNLSENDKREYKKMIFDQLHLLDEATIRIEDIDKIKDDEIYNSSNVYYTDENITARYLTIDYHIALFNRLFNPDRIKWIQNNNINNQNNEDEEDVGKNIIAAADENNKRILDYLNIERHHFARCSYALLMVDINSKNSDLIKKLHKPQVEWLNESNYLILTHNAINQLNMISNNSNEISLFKIINNTKTAMGEKLLRNRLLTPITDIEILNRSYRMIDDYIQCSELIKRTNMYLRPISNLNKLHYKLEKETITPKEFCSLIYSYQSIIKIYDLIDNSNMIEIRTILDTKKFRQLSVFINYITSNLDLEVFNKSKIERVSIPLKRKNGKRSVNENRNWERGPQKCIVINWQDRTPLSKSRTEDLHFNSLKKEYDKIEKIHSKIVDIMNHLKQHAMEHSDNIELKSKTYKHMGYWEMIHISSTTKANNLIKDAMNRGNIDTSLVGKLKFAKTSIESDIIDILIDKFTQSVKEYYVHIWDIYKGIVKGMQKYSFYDYTINFIEQIDFTVSNAEVAIKYSYHRPRIVKGSSYFDMKELRHPISERIIRSQYIENDLSLGLGDRNDILTDGVYSPHGVLLYGTNAAGKSTLLKAIALNMIMAQAGCYVAAKLTYSPYKRILTRLSGNDDLLRSKSLYEIEIDELNTILRNVDESSLVIGDELCRGTEIDSAECLSIATIATLAKKKCSFIFCTHLRDILYDEEIKKLNKSELRIAHLAITYDKERDIRVYNRKLQEGPGNRLYGIDIAKSLHLEESFMNYVDVIQNRRSKENLLPTKTSRYNSKIYVDKCIICGSNNNIHTHHLKEQHFADKRGFIGSMHKDHVSNGISLCDTCHTKIHHNNYVIEAIETMNGRMLKLLVVK